MYILHLRREQGKWNIWYICIYQWAGYLLKTVLFKILMVTGGYDWTFKMDSAELYEPTKGLWRIIEAKLPSPTELLKSTTVDNRVLIMG